MNTVKPKISIGFWIVTFALLIWNLMGITNFFQHIMVSEIALDNMSQNQRVMFENFPTWTLIALGIAVFTGLAGSLSLLFRRKIAQPMFMISIVGIVVQMGHSLSLMIDLDQAGKQWVLIMTVLLIIVGAFSIWFSVRGIEKGWLR